MSSSLQRFARQRLSKLDERRLRRVLSPTMRRPGARILRDGKEFLSFACNDYLGLSTHPALIAAAKAALDEYGAGAGASRLVTGDHPLLTQLEARIAAFKGYEAACVFGAGYLANVGAIPALVRGGDAVFIDALAHACMWDGAWASGAEPVKFRHNDASHLDEILKSRRAEFKHVLVLTDGVFSMDGDIAPLDALSEVCARHECWLMADDAHGLGVIGAGRGVKAVYPGAELPLNMGTLSKAIGSLGGYVCASKEVCQVLKNDSRSLMFATALPPASAAAALAAFDIIEKEPDRVAAPMRNANVFTQALDLPPAQSAIVPLILGEPEKALHASARLAEQGFFVAAIRPPTVPPNTARLRFAFSADHSENDVIQLAKAVKDQVQ